MLGLAALAAQRAGTRAPNLLNLGVGMAVTTVAGLHAITGTVVGRPVREVLGRPAAETRRRGPGIVDTAATQAWRVARGSVDGGVEWLQNRLAPAVVDALVPHLVDSVVPRIIDGTLPHITKTVVPQLIEAVTPYLRTRVLPVVIEDLTDDPNLKTLVLEQSRGIVGEATERLRDVTAQADDRVEAVFRRLLLRRERPPDEAASGGTGGAGR